MKIQSITLTNFRSYREPQTFDNLSNVNTFIGPNASGKSNVFEALKWVQAMVFKRNFKSFNELVFDRCTDSEISISLAIGLSENERRKILEGISTINESKKNDIRSSNFLKSLSYSIILSERGINREELRISNIVSEEAILFVKNVNKKCRQNTQGKWFDSFNDSYPAMHMGHFNANSSECSFT